VDIAQRGDDPGTDLDSIAFAQLEDERLDDVF
jgi:hypothetical protein